MLKKHSLILIAASILFTGSPAFADEKTEITKQAIDVLTHLDRSNYTGLSRFVSPTRPLCFALFVFDDSIKKCFTRDEVAALPETNRSISFGKYEETEFEMNFQEFYQRYLTPSEYLNAEKISFDTSVISLNTTASTPDKEISINYPDSHFVEFMISEEQDGSNKSLFMIFQKSGKTWFISCVTQISASEAHYLF